MQKGTFLVHVESDAASAGRIAIARDLARRFQGCVAGFAASLAVPDAMADSSLVAWSDQAVLVRTDLGSRLVDAETRFRAMVPAAEIAYFEQQRVAPIAALLHLAAAADLAILGAADMPQAGPFPTETLSPGDAILAAGLPVLAVPATVSMLQARNVVVGWAPTRETRRALHDALPFLVAADSVLLLSVIDDDDRYHQTQADLDRAAAWLRRHGVPDVATCIRMARDEHVADKVIRWAQERDADLIVAGGYGHSRARELLLGGTTRALLERSPVCCLFSH
jgi:nucleotide-binding universal stress UspA family protein